ncbi:hypothetical protein BV509_03470 [Rhodovulum sulfidophilum]|uniref:Uncharacterized protein n=1 Tax=Rhodovulum visakhapatnamense TaxID=364297 RepID=A0ABS1RFY5_9RHOB|nr:hypothetical protein [Rhodovulum visakhapatnamense]MBL3570702.1 hypothetical protein [Rhodovulum visakhapatnamense]MBL3578556.1 hypothetical protein [Rhodovulum visakhapatnamense]OLS43475.1 hypothetical protein BV509_03470 [Rhodovulum sulfidophilum]
MALVFSSDYDALPTDPQVRWTKLRDLLERRLAEFSNPSEGYAEEDLIEYCCVLSAAADKLGLGELAAFEINNIRRTFPEFRSSVISLATRLQITSVSGGSENSVAIQRPTRGKITKEIEKLRNLVASSDLPEAQKRKLRDKLDQLQRLIFDPRTDLIKVFAILGNLGAACVNTTALLADAPNAMGTIVALIGHEREEEEKERRLIEAQKVPLQLEDHSQGSSYDDDEIPF